MAFLPTGSMTKEDTDKLLKKRTQTAQRLAEAFTSKGKTTGGFLPSVAAPAQAQLQQGGQGGVGGTAVEGNLANNKVLKTAAPAAQTGLLAPTTLASVQDNIDIREAQALRDTPVARPETTYALPPENVSEIPGGAEFLEQRRLRLGAPSNTNIQGAFDAQGQPVQSGQGTFSVVGQDAETAASNQAFLDQYRAEQAGKVARVREAERIGAIQHGAEKRRDAQRKAIESKLFQMGVGRYRANRKQDAKLLAEVAPFLSGESEAISDDVASQLGLEGQRTQQAGATERARLGSQADIVESQRRALADQFTAQSEAQKEERLLDEALFSQAESLAASDLAEREFAFDVEKERGTAAARSARLGLDQARLERQKERDVVKGEQEARDLIGAAADGAPQALGRVVSAQLGRIRDKEQQKNLLAQLQLQNRLKDEEVDRIAEQYNLLPEEQAE